MRKIVISFITIIILIIGIIVIYPQEKKIIKNKEIKQESFISIMLETDEGNYKKLNQVKWPDREIYTMNASKSYCEQGTKIAWDKETGKINVDVKGTDKCYVYFDKIVGNKVNPYQIKYIEDLVELAKKVNEEEKHYEGEYFVLTKDLDFTNEEDYENAQRTNYGDINGNRLIEPLITELTTEKGWKPIGNVVENYFGGIFDGKDFTISNIHQSNTIAPSGPVGLFGTINGATIKNLTLTGVNEATVSIGGGGIIGKVYGTTRLENLNNEVNVSSPIGEDSIGGVLGASGENANLEIINSTNKGVISGSNNAGGIVGYTNGTLTIDNCINYGEIVNAVGSYAGGLIGQDNATTNKTTITNSHNEGQIITNRTTNTGANIGGFVGRINGELKIENSYNKGIVENQKTTYTSSVNVILGGLVGYIVSNSEFGVIINNCHNEAIIRNGNLTGGIIGAIYGRTKPIIVANCYNTNNIIGKNISTGDTYTPSLVGNAHTTLLYILNSYNTGKITTTGSASGLVHATHETKLNVINSYNAGNQTASGSCSNQAMANGWDTTRQIKSTIKLTNTFGVGTCSGTKTFGVGWFNQSSGTITHSYYPSTYSTALGAQITTGGTSMTLANMKKQSFVDTLNKNTASITLSSDLNGFPLRMWELGSNNIPTFAYDLKDLSGKGNDALDFSVGKTSEGIITSNDTVNGYINTGFVNYNFGNDLSFVVKVKFNKLSLPSAGIIGNWNSAGGGIVIADDNTLHANFYGADLATPAYVSTGNSEQKVELDKWYTLVATTDGNKVILYINGEEVASNALKGKIKPGTAPIAIGGNPTAITNTSTAMDNYSRILVSDALIFDRALTAEEIKKNYKDIPNPENKDELLAWYKFS